jgi:hypothetical protein
VFVGEDLGLDVPRLVEVALDEALAPAERRDGLADRGVEQLGDLFQRARDLQTPATAAERGLDGDGQAVLLGERHDLVRTRDRILGTRHERGARARGDVPRGDLVTEVADGLRLRADPDQAGVDHGLGEVRVLREESVARVHSVRAGPFRHVEKLVEGEIGVAGGGAAERERLVGQPDERCVTVWVRVHGHTRQAGVPARPDHPDGDLPAVGDEYLVQRNQIRRCCRLGHALSSLVRQTPDVTLRAVYGSKPMPNCEQDHGRSF